MYNEDLKNKFIKEYTGSLNTAAVARTLFNNTGKFEEEWGADLCTKSAEELQPLVDEVTGLRSNSKWMTLTILKKYVSWCINNNVPGACDGMLSIQSPGLDKVRKQMVSGPVHLQKYLDSIFTNEAEERLDNVYRCYFWMAFGGIAEDDALLVKNDDVDFSRMVIHCENIDAPIYREALPAFHNAVELTTFAFSNKGVGTTTRRDRLSGDTILRGFKSPMQSLTNIRSAVARLNTNAREQQATNLYLTYNRVRLSGLFYRTYEEERAGVDADFWDKTLHETEERIRFFRTKYSFKGKETVVHKRTKIAKDYFDDYQRWKAAFFS